jgi:hypothetical protein
MLHSQFKARKWFVFEFIVHPSSFILHRQSGIWQAQFNDEIEKETDLLEKMRQSNTLLRSSHDICSEAYF